MIRKAHFLLFSKYFIASLFEYVDADQTEHQCICYDSNSEVYEVPVSLFKYPNFSLSEITVFSDFKGFLKHSSLEVVPLNFALNNPDYCASGTKDLSHTESVPSSHSLVN